MVKIISLFQRNYDGDRLVRDELVPGAEWVQSGEGVATRKWDGTSCLWKNGTLFKRFDAKGGKTPPAGFVPAQDVADLVTGHWPGWLAVDALNPADKWHFEGLENSRQSLVDGKTYELCGPKVQGNPEKLERHTLIPHGEDVIDAPRTHGELKEFFTRTNIEGVVWWHPNGQKVKIKARDFGIKRGIAVGYDRDKSC